MHKFKPGDLVYIRKPSNASGKWAIDVWNYVKDQVYIVVDKNKQFSVNSSEPYIYGDLSVCEEKDYLNFGRDAFPYLVWSECAVLVKPKSRIKFVYT